MEICVSSSYDVLTLTSQFSASLAPACTSAHPTRSGGRSFHCPSPIAPSKLALLGLAPPAVYCTWVRAPVQGCQPPNFGVFWPSLHNLHVTLPSSDCCCRPPPPSGTWRASSRLRQGWRNGGGLARCAKQTARARDSRFHDEAQEASQIKITNTSHITTSPHHITPSHRITSDKLPIANC